MDSSRKPEKSRNASFNKSSTVIVLSKHPQKSITPIKGAAQSVLKSESLLLTQHEKAVALRNNELRKENSELVNLLKKSKEIIKAEALKYKSENQKLKKFLEFAWPLAENKIDEKLRDQIKSGIIIPKVNTGTTEESENIFYEENQSQKDQKAFLAKSLEIKTKIEGETKKCNILKRKIREARQENDSLKQFCKFAIQNKQNDVRSSQSIKDSENIESDEENLDNFMEEIILKKPESEKKNKNLTIQLPGFMKTLMLSKK